MCTVLMGNSSQVLIKKKKNTDLFGNFESINLYIHPLKT